VADDDETEMINRYAALYGEACGHAFQ
jgi:hypothetical protein